jgi:hypothetical protein
MNVINLVEHFDRGFEKGYLEAMRKSDFEVIKDMVERDLKVISLLPRVQQLKIAETIHGVVGEIIARNILPVVKE